MNEEAFTFYKSVLGGEFSNFQRMGDTPQGEHMSDADKKKVMHLTLNSEKGTIMGNDHMDFMGPFQPAIIFRYPCIRKARRKQRVCLPGFPTEATSLCRWIKFFGALILGF
jgi:uncharacterized glyoxalase superfamily protein PhnB